MKFEVSLNPLGKISSDGLVVFLFEQKEGYIETESFSKLDKILGGYLTEAVKLENFKAKPGNSLSVFTHKKTLSSRVYVVGLGPKDQFNANELRHVLALFAKLVNKKVNSVAISLLKPAEGNIDSFLQAQMMSEGLLLGSYSFTKYQKKESQDDKEFELVIFSESNINTKLKIKEGIKMAETYYTGTKIARDLVNEPAALVTPTFLAKMALDIAKSNKDISCKVLDKMELEKLGMGAFLGIAQAADTPPKFIYLEYTPKEKSGKSRKVALVGKGITFDSGGISIKPGDKMTTMKLDMAGAAAVLGVFSVISKIKPSFPVAGFIAATPNLISGKAIVPGDVVKAINGKTIEILNTDAEGRVTLADSLSYAVKKGATEIIDLATLTGACMIALGDDIAGLFGNDNKLKEKVKKSADKAGEDVWELPLVRGYKKLNKSEVADISNIPSSRYGGAITAALFLEEFVNNKPWVHLDIAGPSFAEKSFDLGPKGGTGFGVRTLLNFLREG